MTEPRLTKAQMQAIQRAALNRAKKLNPHRDSVSPPAVEAAPGMLTDSEIADLQQRKRELSAYARKAFASKK